MALYYVKYDSNILILAQKAVQLSEEAKSQILQSQDFAHFFEHAARIIEKAICEDDFAFDYGAVTDDGERYIEYYYFIENCSCR